MRLLAFVFWACPVIVGAQKPVTKLDLRTGRSKSASFRFGELSQRRGPWIVPRVGYAEFYSERDHHKEVHREFFLGGGYMVLSTSHVVVSEGLYFVRAGGTTNYLQPWTEIEYHLSPMFGGKTILMPYIPISEEGHSQFVLDRTGIEYGPSALKVGVGYGAYKEVAEQWTHSPFVTLTIDPFHGQLGRVELWHQWLRHGGAQLQARYELRLGGKEKH